MSDIYGSRPSQDRFGSDNGTEDFKEQARAAGGKLKNKASDASSSVVKSAKEHASTISNTAKDVASAATGKVKGVMNDQKGVGADYLGNLAQAANRAASEFDMDVPQAARYIRQAAGQIETVANAIRMRDVGELVSEVQQFARRQPTLFFGGAMILGFAALRFFKSSSDPSQMNSGSDQTRMNTAMGGASDNMQSGAWNAQSQ
jgi:hypothetical protein